MTHFDINSQCTRQFALNVRDVRVLKFGSSGSNLIVREFTPKRLPPRIENPEQ